MRIRYTIAKLGIKDKVFDRIRRNKLVSTVVIAGYAIIARYGVNKSSLRSILRKHLEG